MVMPRVPGVPRHSVESLNLRCKARKLAQAQRYVEAARLQKQAERVEAKWYASQLVKVKEKEDTRLQEKHAWETARLEEKMQREEQRLVEKSVREQELMLRRHDISKGKLAARQQKTWTSFGGSAAGLEQALRALAAEPKKERPSHKTGRSASAPASRPRPRSAVR